MIQFAKEPLTDALWAEAMPLLQAHWKEVAHFQDIPLDPDRDLYAASEEAGILRVFTAREIDEYAGNPKKWPGEQPMHGGELVGYALYFVRPAPHYQSSVQAVQDVLYLAPTHRGRTAYKFVSWCDEQLSTEGVQVTYHHVKASKDFGPMLEHQGYELVDRIYAKRLDGAGRIGDTEVATSSYVSYTRPKPATWKGQSVKVIGERDGRAVLIVDGYASSNTAPIKEIEWLDRKPEMGQDWRDQAQHDYDTARFVGVKP